jgi:hypothetical protein
VTRTTLSKSQKTKRTRVTKAKILKQSDLEIKENLPLPPPFDRFESKHQPHLATPLLPPELPFDPARGLPNPLETFSLFFSDDILEHLVENTNLYAFEKRTNPPPPESLATQDTPSPSHHHDNPRPWYDLTIGEIKIFVGIQIYMGVYRYPAIEDYWTNTAKHSPMSRMSCNRYQQIKRYFYISPPGVHLERKDWWKKMEPLASYLRERFSKYYLPASDLAFDEMMVLFKGRSAHTIKMKNKPIDEGYKIYAMCEHGYTYLFLFNSGGVGNEESDFTSRTTPFTQISPSESLALFNFENKVLDETRYRAASTGFSSTSQAVCHLVFALPYQQYRFTIYMDNYFTSIPLFRHLRNYGIGAVGTTRPHQQKKVMHQVRQGCAQTQNKKFLHPVHPMRLAQ